MLFLWKDLFTYLFYYFNGGYWAFLFYPYHFSVLHIDLEIRSRDEKSHSNNYVQSSELTNDPQQQILLFVFLHIDYMLNITGSLIIILLTIGDAHLKTLMYYFLKKFSFLEMLFISVGIPQFLYSVATGD